MLPSTVVDPAKLRQLAALLDERAALKERLAKVLTPAQQRDVLALEDLSARIGAAEAALTAGGQNGNTDEVVTAGSVRVSLRAVAEAVGVSHALLSQARKGTRRIRKSMAEQIEALTPSLPATKKTWPKGWIPE